MIRHALGCLSRSAPFTASPSGTARAGSALTPRVGSASTTGQRWISAQRSLDLPDAWLKVDTTPQAHQALKKLAGPPLDDWYRNADSHLHATRHLNQRLASLSRADLQQAGLHPQELLSLVLMSQQAMHRVRRTHQDGGTLSMAMRLLSFIPVPARLKHHMGGVCQDIVNEAAGSLRLFDASRDWVERSPQEREQLIKACFHRSKALIPTARSPMNCLDDVLLEFVPASDPRLHGMFSGRLSTVSGLDGKGGTQARLYLSQDLIDMDARDFARACPHVPATGDLPSAIVPMLLAHELWHGFQHHLLDSLPLGLRAGPASEEALCMALSIGTQEVIHSESLGIHNTEAGRFLTLLPHEQQAWAMTFLMVRALVRHPEVPDRVKAAARAYAADGFSIFSRLFGTGSPSRPAGPDGEFWAGHELCLMPEAPPDRASRLAAIDGFLGQGS